MHHFCTYLDRNYLTRALSLYISLERHCSAFHIWMLCMDAESHDTLSKLDLPYVDLIALEELEQSDSRLAKAKVERTLVEYYFTCTPSLPFFILNNYDYVQLITYIDADLYFFADPIPVFDEIGHGSVAIIPHRHSQPDEDLAQYGIYNVGWVSFRRDGHGLSCLEWWRESCVRWCYDRPESGRFADQKYLDHFPILFQNVVVLDHKGANLAPWNIANYEIGIADDCVMVDEQLLIFYHFQGFRQVAKWLYNPNLAGYGARSSSLINRAIYGEYIRVLWEVSAWLGLGDAGLSPLNTLPRGVAGTRGIADTSFLLSVFRWWKGLLRVCRGIIGRHYVLVVGGRVLR